MPKRNRYKKKRWVYKLKLPKPKESTLKAILRIMDESDHGPMPMKFFKPTKKIRNNIELFNAEHQGQYEMRGRPSRNPMQAIDDHYSAYPKLYEELEKKQSLTKAKAVRAAKSKQTYYDPDCKQCKKLLQARTKRECKGKRNCCTYRGDDIRTYVATSKIRSQKNPIERFKKRQVSKGIQAIISEVVKKNQGTSFLGLKLSETIVNTVANIKTEPPDHFMPVDEKLSQKTAVESSNQSMTSYNSFASMEHEPMV